MAGLTGELRAVLDERSVESLVKTRAGLSLDDEMARIERLGITVLTREDDDYPRLLAQIPAPPSVLYVKGELLPEDAVAVAIVGTRRLTSYGREVTGRLAGDLARAGVTVVSGLARGIDAVAHQAALRAGGRTIAVLGSGPNVIYPPEHRHLAAEIVENGALVSDYPPDRKPDAPNFPARNRIISGLTLGVIVVEVPARMGVRQYNVPRPATVQGCRYGCGCGKLTGLPARGGRSPGIGPPAGASVLRPMLGFFDSLHPA